MGENSLWGFIHVQRKRKTKKIDTAAKLVERVYIDDCSSYLILDIGLSCTGQIQIEISSKLKLIFLWLIADTGNNAECWLCARTYTSGFILHFA